MNGVCWTDDEGWCEPPDILLPDGVVSYEHPLLNRPLRPLEDFDRPELKAFADADLPEYLADGGPSWFLRKHCAGLAHDLRITVADFRRILDTGEFTEREHFALDWVFGGMRTAHVFVPSLLAGTRVTIHQIVRLLWNAFNGDACGAHAYLNQWADDPSHPLPVVSNLTRELAVPARISQHYRNGLLSREQAVEDLKRFPWPPDLRWDPFVGPPDPPPRAAQPSPSWRKGP